MYLAVKYWLQYTDFLDFSYPPLSQSKENRCKWMCLYIITVCIFQWTRTVWYGPLSLAVLRRRPLHVRRWHSNSLLYASNRCPRRLRHFHLWYVIIVCDEVILWRHIEASLDILFCVERWQILKRRHFRIFQVSIGYLTSVMS